MPPPWCVSFWAWAVLAHLLPDGQRAFPPVSPCLLVCQKWAWPPVCGARQMGQTDQRRAWPGVLAQNPKSGRPPRRWRQNSCRGVAYLRWAYLPTVCRTLAGLPPSGHPLVYRPMVCRPRVWRAMVCRAMVCQAQRILPCHRKDGQICLQPSLWLRTVSPTLTDRLAGGLPRPLPLRHWRATWRQRITHFTEELTFLSDSDREWVIGRSILERLKWA